MTMEFGEMFYEPKRLLVDEKQVGAILLVAPKMGIPVSIVAKSGESYISVSSGEACLVGKRKTYIEIDNGDRDLTKFWQKVAAESRS